ncbi:MAG: copper homeostasis protein CutC [Cyclobacteriaceae bacterium]|nr:copper homeostasis protein CutC [Cyclobacteriaceae bacterium]
MILEACVENINEAIAAERLGANRIELCDNLHVGGTTPSYGTIFMAKKTLLIPIMVLIRPRGGNFIYNSHEIEIMKKDIAVCRDIGVQGVVIGALRPDSTIDIDLMKELVALAHPLDVTFHKAIDETPNILRECGKLGSLGINRLLTSGGKPTALEGAGVINQMIAELRGSVDVIAAGKITRNNLDEIKKVIKGNEYHGRLIVGKLQ